MSVWPKAFPAVPPLSGAEGELVSIFVEVEAHRLERLLDALAQVTFPVNPQLYHEGAVVYRYARGPMEIVDTTLVEFPAYAGRVNEVRRAIEAYGFSPASVHCANMLSEIHSEPAPEPAPPGAKYVSRQLVRSRRAAVQ